jgi:hypothetical protein
MAELTLPVVVDAYDPAEFRNWRYDPSGIARFSGQPGDWVREREGRSTLWEAKVWEEDGRFIGRVWRRSEVNRRLRSRVVFSLEIGEGADGCWTFGPFSAPGYAIAFTETWIKTRRSRSTWQNPDPPFPVGDRYGLRVVDEEKAMEWPRRQDGVEVVE